MMKNLFPRGATMLFGGTGGIGRVVAKEFAKAGSNIAVMYRSKKDIAHQLVEEAQAMEQKASCHPCDVTDHEALGKAIQDAIKQHDRIHTMVWGAGPLAQQLLINETSREQWRNAVNIETHGFYGTHHWWSIKHLHRYVSEYAYRQNTIGLSGEPALGSIIRASEGKRLTYAELIQ